MGDDRGVYQCTGRQRLHLPLSVCLDSTSPRRRTFRVPGPARIDTRILRRAYVLSTPPNYASNHEHPANARDRRRGNATRRDEGSASAAQTKLPLSRGTNFLQEGDLEL
ncbi:hypothetical protein PG994_015180 [Apiospora phragmitis]|uniref:Uncharacterized protein n=1 Tax=Apiospora phragmitis TaxID=2905665 RepID=A0ABR1SVR8_9PEZI